MEYEIKPVDEIVYIYPALENLYIYYYQKTMTNLLMNLIRYLKNIKQNVTQIIIILLMEDTNVEMMAIGLKNE